MKPTITFLTALLLSPLAVLHAQQERAATMKNAFIINEDNSHFYSSRPAEDMTLKGLNAFVDQYAGTAVTHLFLCPNAMRASFRSSTREAIWDVIPSQEEIPERRRRWPDNARLLHERGLDPYAVWIARAREKGLSPWLSMRMNDVHDVPHEKDFMHSSFWHDHPESWRVPNTQGGAWTDRALNYAHPAVREYNLAFVKELLERYDLDGLELDWMRFGRHLTPGKEQDEGEILTAFVREVRKLTNEWAEKRGHSILLGARVPAHPDAAIGLGMDGVTWGREGLVDLLVPCPFWTTSDFDIPVELWKERLGDADVAIAPGLEHNSRPWPGGKPVANALPCVYGFAVSARHRGADAIYLFNFMDSCTRPVPASDYRVLVEKGVGETFIASQAKRFPVCFRDTVPKGFPNGVTLPVKGKRGGSFRIHTGPAPTAGTACVVLGLAKADDLSDAAFAVTVNGQTVAPGPDLPSCAGLGGAPARALTFAVPLSALCDQHNTVEVTQLSPAPEQTVVWAEIRLTPSPDTRPTKIWDRTGPLGETPKHVTDAYPLSDQENKRGWAKVEALSDEFDSQDVDLKKWTRGLGWWKGRQPALFSDKNVTVSDGKLHLTMRKEKLPEEVEKLGYKDYTSACLYSKVRAHYGYYEVKAKPMNSAGSSSFWFQKEDVPGWMTEIDVFEIGGNAKGYEHKYNMNLHVFKTPNEKKHWSVGGVWVAPWRLADEYHVYGLEWTPEEIKYYVDGVVVRAVENTHWHQPLFMIFDSETMPNWFGMPKDEDLPSTYSVEYVRAWKQE